jgi:hypothetical protein
VDAADGRDTGPASISRWIIVGTRNVCVPPSRLTAWATASGLKLRKITLVPPTAMNARSLEPLPCVSGPACTIVGAAASRNSDASMLSIAATRVPCLLVAPFGRPVVPLV